MNRMLQLTEDLKSCNQPKLAQTILAKIIFEATELMIEYEASETSTGNAGPLGLGNLRYSVQTKKKDDGAALTGLAAMLVVLASDASNNSHLREHFMNQASSLLQKILSNFGIQTGMISAKLQTVLKSSSRLSEMREELEKASKQASQEAEQIPVLSKSLEEAKRQFLQYQAENRDSIFERETLQLQMSNLIKQVNSLEADRQKVIDLQSKVTHFKSMVTENEAKAKELEAEISELRNREEQLANTVKNRIDVTRQLVDLTKLMDDNVAKKIQHIWEQLPKDQLDMMLNWPQA